MTSEDGKETCSDLAFGRSIQKIARDGTALKVNKTLEANITDRTSRLKIGGPKRVTSCETNLTEASSAINILERLA
ncbi:hypothetical protein L596_004123 [Steinernema carpocapsae]|uniref:Uncharacterized protein n=1 Tax=Steinernema carpocapsae TaxID=34508 RepID=A0A4V6I806_STECR|nr:hypothetical protein L596_004123 [Steinernema carpocapsae]